MSRQQAEGVDYMDGRDEDGDDIVEIFGEEEDGSDESMDEGEDDLHESMGEGEDDSDESIGEKQDDRDDKEIGIQHLWPEMFDAQHNMYLMSAYLADVHEQLRRKAFCNAIADVDAEDWREKWEAERSLLKFEC